MRSQGGQVAVEFVLGTVVVLGITLGTAAYFKRTGIVADFIAGPWKILAGMIESGVWRDQTSARTLHPGHLNRHVSIKGEQL